MWYMYMYLQSSVVKSNGGGGGGGTTHYYRRDASSTTKWKHCSSIVEYIGAKSGREGGFLQRVAYLLGFVPCTKGIFMFHMLWVDASKVFQHLRMVFNYRS